MTIALKTPWHISKGQVPVGVQSKNPPSPSFSGFLRRQCVGAITSPEEEKMHRRQGKWGEKIERERRKGERQKRGGKRGEVRIGREDEERRGEERTER